MKKITIFIIGILLVMTASLPVSANALRLVDEAGLLSESEFNELIGYLDMISEKHNCDVVVYTKYGTESGMSTMGYCDYIFENNYGVGPELDGVILFINMSEREWQIDTSGKIIASITDFGLEYIEEKMIGDLSAGRYYRAFKSFADMCDKLITIDEEGEPYDIFNYKDYAANGVFAAPKFMSGYDSSIGDFELSIGPLILMSLLFGFIVSIITVSVMKSRLKSVNSKYSASAYVDRQSIKITQSRDIFLYKNVRKTRRVESSSSSGGRSGGSTIHHSSSGHSFGGRGGKF